MSPEEQALAQSEPEAQPETAQEPGAMMIDDDIMEDIAAPAMEVSQSDEASEAERITAMWQHAYDAMRKDIGSWGMWLSLLGVSHVLASGFLSAGWGVLLIIVGGGSFLFQDAAMYVIYAATLAWAAISNLISGAGGWIAMSILQLYFAYKVSRSYVTYRKVQIGYTELIEAGEVSEPSDLHRARDLFPWLGIATGLLSFLGLIFIFFSLFTMAVAEMAPMPNWIAVAYDFDLNLAVLAVAISLAALLSRYPRKIFSILGLIAGGLVILAYLGLSF